MLSQGLVPSGLGGELVLTGPCGGVGTYWTVRGWVVFEGGERERLVRKGEGEVGEGRRGQESSWSGGGRV